MHFLVKCDLFQCKKKHAQKVFSPIVQFGAFLLVSLFINGRNPAASSVVALAIARCQNASHQMRKAKKFLLLPQCAAIKLLYSASPMAMAKKRGKNG